jgi:hypothetical protein
MDGELTDEQIEELLARATARMKAKSGQKKTDDVLKLNTTERYTFPKLDPGQLQKSYISQEDGVSNADSSRLVDEQQRKQANAVRKVQDPKTAKKLSIEVCYTLFEPFIFAMRKYIPIILEQSPGTVLVSLSAQ